MNRHIPGIALASAVALSGCAAEQPFNGQAMGSYESVTDAEIELIEANFRPMKQYWLGQGVDVMSTNLRIVQDVEIFVCPGQGTILAEQIQAVYCSPTDTVVMAEGFIVAAAFDSVIEGISSSDVVDIAIAHELGHAVQYAQAAVPGQLLARSVEKELQADCFAGLAIRHTNPVQADSLLANQELIIHGDERHGSGQQRFDNLTNGLAGGSCK